MVYFFLFDCVQADASSEVLDFVALYNTVSLEQCGQCMVQWYRKRASHQEEKLLLVLEPEQQREIQQCEPGLLKVYSQEELREGKYVNSKPFSLW